VGQDLTIQTTFIKKLFSSHLSVSLIIINLISILLIMYQGQFSAILEANNLHHPVPSAKVSTARFFISKQRLVDIGCDPSHVLD
jgi:hypothetical protein